MRSHEAMYMKTVLTVEVVGTLVLITTEDPGFPQWPPRGAGRAHRPAGHVRPVPWAGSQPSLRVPQNAARAQRALKDAAPTH